MNDDKALIAILGSLGGTIAFWSFIIAYQLNGIKNAIREHNVLRKEWRDLNNKENANAKDK